MGGNGPQQILQDAAARPRTSWKLRDSVLFGLVQGPSELLPVSSSGHLVIVPWLIESGYTELEPELRKAFEVALHAGTAAALLITLRGEVGSVVEELDAQRVARMILTFLPAAAAALLFERQIERHASKPVVVALGMLAGSTAMIAADRCPQTRSVDDATWRDGLALGVAQATALVPGVSRNGATLVAARMRRFKRADANRLSRHAALPVIGGATALKGFRLAKRGLPAGAGKHFAAGVAASFGSSIASVRLISTLERNRSLVPYALYRIGFAGFTMAVARRRRKTISLQSIN